MFGGGMSKRMTILNYVLQSGGKVAVRELVQELDTKEKDVKKAVEWGRKKMGWTIQIEDEFVVLKGRTMAQLKAKQQQQQPTVVREVVYMIKCDNCQHDNLQGTQKCTNCGAPL